MQLAHTNLPLQEEEAVLNANGGVYEYIATYVDDLALALKDPQAFTDALRNEHGFKLKGTGLIAFHLGCDFTRDAYGTLCMAPVKH